MGPRSESEWGHSKGRRHGHAHRHHRLMRGVRRLPHRPMADAMSNPRYRNGHRRLEVSAVSLRRCAWHNCPQLVPQGTRFCKAHAHAYERGRGTSGQRGYGAAHRRERARWQAAMDSGVVPVCAKCNQPVLPSQAWDLGHTDDRKAWTGPEHRSCNRRDGQHKAISHQERWH